jgi:DNA-binding MarR family transcriptional regulator
LASPRKRSVSAPTPTVGATAARLARLVEVALMEIDLSISQYRVLLQLAQGTEASTALAKKLAVSPPAVTAVIDGLAQRGAVDRSHSSEDRRRVSLVLTKSGHDLLRRAERVVAGRLAAIADELDDPVDRERALEGLLLWGIATERARARRLERVEPAPVTAQQR